MISKGQLHAKIDKESRTVKFVEDSDMLELVDKLDMQNRRIVDLMKIVDERNE
jgi:hypothetical protein